MGKGLLGSGMTCLLPLGETDVVDCGLIHAKRNQPRGQNLGSPGWAQSWPHLVSISHLTSVDGWWGQGSSGIPRAENGAVRARRRLAGLLMDTVRDLVLTLAAQLLVYPHRVLVTLVTPLEPSLLNVSVMDFRTRRALSVKFLVPPWPACDFHGSRIPSSGSSIQRPRRGRQIPAGAWTPSRPAGCGQGAVHYHLGTCPCRRHWGYDGVLGNWQG